MHLKGRLRLLLATAVAGVIGLVGTMTVPQMASANHTKECVTLNLIERLDSFDLKSPPGTTDVGLFGTFVDKAYWTLDSTEVIATGIGTFDVLYKRPSDGHLIEFVTEQWQFPDGDFMMTGYVDRWDLVNSKMIVDQLTGMSGKYAGMKGTLRWYVPPPNWEMPGYPAVEEFHVCR